MEQLHSGLAATLQALYNATATNAHTLGNSANAMFEVCLAGKPAILRVSPHSARKEAHVAFELSWMQHLCAKMAHIAGPIPSVHGRLYETAAAAGQRYILSVFQKAPGRLVDAQNPREWNTALFRHMGEVMGEMHRNTEAYAGEHGARGAFNWRHNYLFAPEYTRVVDADIEPLWEQLLGEMAQLPQTRATYGIIHNDMHYQNFHVQNGSITLFDFDDCEYNWYAHDVASACFFALVAAGEQTEEERQALAEAFLVPFLQGYLPQKALPREWLERLGLFLRYRMLAQYKFITNFLPGMPPEEQRLCAPLAAWLKQKIQDGRGYVPLHYNRIAGQVY